MERLKYLKRYIDRHGQERVYFNRTGSSKVALPGPVGSEAFRVAYQAALAASEGRAVATRGSAPQRPAPRPDEATMADLITRYYRSLAYKTLAPTTKRSYRSVIEQIRSSHGDKPVALLDRRGVRAQLAKMADRPGAANNFLRHLRLLMGFAIEEEMRADDPTARVRPLAVPGDGFQCWTEGDIAKFEEAHPIGSRARLAFALLLFTAQRRGDVIRLGRANLVDGRIKLKQSKTGAVLDLPVHPDLAVALRTAPVGAATFLVTGKGKPFTAAGFGNWFGDQCRIAKVSTGASAHGLRKAAARRLAEAGCTTREIMAITGHKTLREIERYTRAVSQEGLAGEAMGKLRARGF
jgi:integrase